MSKLGKGVAVLVAAGAATTAGFIGYEKGQNNPDFSNMTIAEMAVANKLQAAEACGPIALGKGAATLTIEYVPSLDANIVVGGSLEEAQKVVNTAFDICMKDQLFNAQGEAVVTAPQLQVEG